MVFQKKLHVMERLCITFALALGDLTMRVTLLWHWCRETWMSASAWTSTKFFNRDGARK
jgi:hypothetical protein